MEVYRRPDFVLAAEHLFDLVLSLDRAEALRVLTQSLECSYDLATQAAAEVAEDCAVLDFGLSDEQSDELHDAVMANVVVRDEEDVRFLSTLFLINAK